MKRSISGIFTAKKVNMGGIFLYQALPIANLEQVDPFLLIHHWDKPLKGGQKQKDVGVGPHPHRGFSPVTIIFKGAVHHRDSRGNDSVVRQGGAQWMHSGMGIVHSERPDNSLAQQGGDFEIVQFWVNVPARYKMVEPLYHAVSENEIPNAKSDDHKIEVSILAGELDGLKGPVKTFTDMSVFVLDCEEGGKFNLPLPENMNAMLYQLDGKLIINDQFNSTTKQLVWFKNNGARISIECAEKSRAILFAGNPINEEVTSSGPFVTNTHTEILEAMRDYQMGKMGILIEDFE